MCFCFFFGCPCRNEMLLSVWPNLGLNCLHVSLSCASTEFEQVAKVFSSLL